MKSKTVFLGLIICVLFQMSSCKKEQDAIKVGIFNGLPPEIDGCACYFSRNEKEFKSKKYILADDYLNNAYIIINDEKNTLKNVGAAVKAKGNDIHWSKTFKNEKYEVTIEMFETGEIDETSQQKGVVTIKSVDGNQITETFYGECGC